MAKDDDNDAYHKERSNSWINTYTGKVFYPLDPRPEDLCLEDIAHSLSMQCRWNGHTLRYYSVARHSVLVASLVPDRAKPYALLHDATEAYLTDIPRPLKPHLTNYAEFEQALEAVIIERYGIAFDEEIKTLVKRADADMLIYERRMLIKEAPKEWGYEGIEPSTETQGMSLVSSPDYDKQRFLNEAQKLGLKD